MAENPEDLIVTDAELRRQLPALAKELKIGGSGVEQVSGTVALQDDGPRVLEYYTTGITTFTSGPDSLTVGEDTALVFRRLASGLWEHWVVGQHSSWQSWPALEPDNTAPTAGTLTVSNITADGATLTVSGASDNQRLHVTPYRFSTNNGVTWSAWQQSATYTFTGMAELTPFTAIAEVRDAAGLTSRTASKAGTTASVAVTVETADVADAFTAADNTYMVDYATASGATVQRTTDKGALKWGYYSAIPMLPVPNNLQASGAYPGGPRIVGNAAAFGVGGAGAQLKLAKSTYKAQFTYNGNAQPLNIVMGGDGTNGFNIRYFVADGGFKVFKTGGGTVGPVGVAPTTGTASVSYNPTDGRLTIIVDGSTVYSQITTPGWDTSVFGFAASPSGGSPAGAPTVDNLVVKYL